MCSLGPPIAELLQVVCVGCRVRAWAGVDQIVKVFHVQLSQYVFKKVYTCISDNQLASTRPLPKGFHSFLKLWIFQYISRCHRNSCKVHEKVRNPFLEGLTRLAAKRVQIIRAAVFTSTVHKNVF